MIVLDVLVPVAFVGLIAWIAVGIRRNVVEAFTLPGGAAFYANLMSIVALTMSLLGVALAVKVFIGFLNLNWSYGSTLSILGSSLCPNGVTGISCPPTTTPDFTPRRTDDVALAIVLFAAGLALLVIHRLLARSARRLPGGLPAWVQRGTLFGFAVLYGSAALLGIVATAYGIVTYVITPMSSMSAPEVVAPPGPFGEVVGAAAAFIPAWLVSFVLLMRKMRNPVPTPPAVTVSP